MEKSAKIVSISGRSSGKKSLAEEQTFPSQFKNDPVPENSFVGAGDPAGILSEVRNRKLKNLDEDLNYQCEPYAVHKKELSKNRRSVGNSGDVQAGSIPEPEVRENPGRRRFSGKYKLKILNEIDSAKSGQIGAILRREGLYSSTVANWRKQRDRGQLEGLSSRKRGPKPKRPNPRDKEIEQLKREKASLEKKLHKANLLLDLQKKVSEIMGIPMAELDEEDL